MNKGERLKYKMMAIWIQRYDIKMESECKGEMIKTKKENKYTDKMKRN